MIKQVKNIIMDYLDAKRIIEPCTQDEYRNELNNMLAEDLLYIAQSGLTIEQYRNEMNNYIARLN